MHSYVERLVDSGAMCNENLYNLSLEEIAARGIQTLPQSLKEAADALEADPLFREVLGAEIVDEFIKLKRMEWVEYSRHVSDWEIQRYTEFF
jgi:glutamine synthetase